MHESAGSIPTQARAYKVIRSFLIILRHYLQTVIEKIVREPRFQLLNYEIIKPSLYEGNGACVQQWGMFLVLLCNLSISSYISIFL